MKKGIRKGQLYKRGKRSLALLLSVCLIGTMIPVTARAESGNTNTGLCEHHTEHTAECGYVAPVEGHACEHVHDDSCGYQEASECTHVHTEECGENGENCVHEHTSECGYAEGHVCEHVHDEECGYVEGSVGSPCAYVCDICKEEAEQGKTDIIPEENLTVQTQEQTTDKLITAWQWVDEEEYLDEETGNLALPGASEEMPAHFDDITALLPTQIQATVENAENTEAEAVAETITLGDWVCEDYPKDGAYSGSYTFNATLPEGYSLSEEAEALTVLVELGGAQQWNVTGVSYRSCDGNGTNWTTATCTDAAEVTNADTAWGTSGNDTWYVVNGDVTIGSADTVQRVTVNGNVHLILTDGCNLIVNGGIGVDLDSSLTIYGQTAGTGALEARNVGDRNAGIGGGYGGNFSGGAITINGGTITATGGYAGAGIGGGGVSTSGYLYDKGGPIIINGGTINANGGLNGAGIGDGKKGAGGRTITINGGTINAIGKDYAAGIGSGSEGSSGGTDNGSIIINISGGSITATGGYKGAGIGGGSSDNGGVTINISGGTINATGGAMNTSGTEYAAGIGKGYNSKKTISVSITNSVVMASSISDTSSQDIWSGLIFNGEAGKLYGDSFNIATDCTIPSGKTLEVAAGQTVSIDDVTNFVNNGVICNSGTITGMVTNNGTIHNTGTISGASGGTINHYSIEPIEMIVCKSAELTLKVNNTNTFEETVTYALSAEESNAIIENESTLKVKNQDVVGSAIPVTATFTINGVTMTRTENVTITGHTYGTNGFCNNCNSYQPATLTTDKHDINGDGNKDNVYEIKNAGQLYWFADKVNNENSTYGSANAILVDNITVNEKVLVNGDLNSALTNLRSWTPIGNDSSQYTGTFDGQGHTVSGLYFDDGNGKYVGLFGSIQSGSCIKKVGVLDSYFNGKNSVGGVCGLNQNGTIENCYSKSYVSGTENIGGVCGYNYSKLSTATIKNCHNEGKVSGSDYVGGVCGFNNDDDSEGVSTIEYCYNTGEVSSAYHVGGVCGWNRSVQGSSEIKNCYNVGKVSGTNYIGGVCGYNYSNGGISDITTCFNTGKVSGTGDVIGGVCGLNSQESGASATVTDCYYLAGCNTEGTSFTCEKGTSKTAEEFASGLVCYLLNGSSSENPVWYQNIDCDGVTADPYPVLDSDHGTVYQCTPCTAVYSNTSGKTVAHTFHVNENDNTKHICEKCGATEAHSTTNFTYSADEGKNRITVYCNEGGCGANIGYVELAAPSGTITYDGTKKEATVSDTVDGVDFSTSTAIAYKQGETTLSSAPKDAGTYTASITLGTGEGAATVSVEFTIGKATPELGTVSVTPLSDTLDTSQVVFNRTDTSVSGTFALTDVTKLQYGTYDYAYVFTPDDTDNYKPVTGTVSITVNDTIAPTADYQIGENGWKKFVNTISFGLFCKDYKTVEITYSDVNASGEPGSGVKTKQYYIANKELTEAEIEALQWNNYSDTISLDAKGVYFIYVKVEDNAGNSVVLNSEGIVIYADSALSPESMDYTYKENKDLEVQVTMNGNTFGKLTDGAGTEIAAENYTIDEAGKLTLKAAYLDTLNVGEYTYKVYMNPQGQTTDTVTLTYSFVVNIKACELTVTGATATARKYDTTNVVNITAVELNGIKGTDDVSVNTTSLTGTLTGANVGNYTSVTLPALTLTGTAAGNYTLVQPTGAVPTNVTISKADAAITIDTGKDSYSKTFGNADFTLSGISDTNTEADVQYAVTAGEDVVSVSNGTVTILNAGTATITVSLPASTNYNAADSKTITVTVEKKSGYTVADINKSYLYSRDNAENIDLSKYLPSNCGTVSYGTPQVNEGLYTDGGQPEVSSDGKLSYTVKTGSVGDNGTIKVAVTTVNYVDFTITVNVNLTDKLPVSLKDGASVTLQNSILTYGQTLSTLAFNSAVFVNDGGNVVAGTLSWKTPDEKPNAGTTSATWVFTPDDEAYAAVEDTVAITVNKATPNVTALPTVTARTYHPTASLTNDDLVGGTVNVEGSWSWQSANIIPVVNNSGYVAVFTPTDSTNYETVTKTITVTVSKATPYIATAPTAAAITYGDTLGASTLNGGTVQYSDSDATTVSGSFAWKDNAVKPSVSDSNTTTYRLVFTPSDAVNYNTAETDITLTVNKADNAPNMPSSTMNVANSCTKVSDVTIPTGWVWQDADKNTALVVDTPVTATAVYNGADKGNYENETVSVSITRSECEHAHTEVRNAKESTCKETGYTGDTYCTDCGALLSTGTTIPLADHQGGTATCTKKAVCTVCGKEYGTLDANNHVHTEIKGAVAATCTAGGYTGDTYCTDCGVKIKTGTAIPAFGHNYTSKVTTEPTTDREGVRTYTCDRCGHSYTESIPKLPEETHEHSYSGSVTKEPTCTDTGVRTYTCSCGDSYTETIPALGHHYVSSVTKEPTTSSEGVMTYTCDRCGHSYTRAIAKLQDTNNNNPGENQPGAENKPDTGKPYIKDENGKEGWDVIKDEVDKTKDGDTVTVEMNGTSVVPGDVLDDIKGKDVTIVFDMGGGITWSVNGKSITADRVGDIDFTVKADTNTIPVDIINNVTGERYSKQISLSYDGEFGFTAVLSINMEASNAGLYANLFYYNEKTGEMEFICADEIAADGTAELTFTHASDYAIVIDKEPMEGSVQVDRPASESQDTETESTQTGAEVSNDAWNPWWIIVIGIMVIVIGLGVFLVAKKNKSDDE